MILRQRLEADALRGALDLDPALADVRDAGRLEVVTVFAVFTRDWWRLPRRNVFRRPDG